MTNSQFTDTLEPGDIIVSKQASAVIGASNVGASVIVILYDMMAKIVGIAHIVLPDSTVSPKSGEEEKPGKYADTGIPALLEAYLQEGGQLASTRVLMTGGAQLFNFGGGSGNPLNIGARCATTIKATLMRSGLTVDREDVGGNKARRFRFVMANGQARVTPIGEPEKPLG